MKKLLLAGVTGAVTILAVQSGLAQAFIDLSAEQERSVYTTLHGARVTTGVAPREFDVSVGAVVPAEVELVEVPASVEIAPLQRYRYVTLGNRVVFIEPGSRKVVKVIAP